MQFVRRLPAVADMTLVTAGAMTANIASYLLQVLAAGGLGTAGYGAFASLLAVQLLCAVPALALQNVVARELVHGVGVRQLRGLSLRCAVVVAVVAVALVPVVTLVLDVGVFAAAAALGSAPALVLVAGEQGVLQGQRRFRGLAVVLGATGIAKVAPGLIVLAAGGGVAEVLWAAALGIVGAAAYARIVAGPARLGDGAEISAALDGTAMHRATVGDAASGRTAMDKDAAGEQTASGAVPDGRVADGAAVDKAGVGESAAGGAVPGGSVADVPGIGEAATSAVGRVETGDKLVSGEREGVGRWAGAKGRGIVAGVLAVVRAAQVQAALMALSSADLIVVRIVLEESDAGRYALGTVATKIAFWLPQAVGVVLYPRMAQPAHSASAVRSALAVLSGIGVAGVLGALVAAPLAPLVAGEDYAPIQGLLWAFALHGALLAVLQGALLSAIAANRTALAWLAWLGLAVEFGLMLGFATTVVSLIATVVSVAGVTTVLVALIAIRTAGRAPDAVRAARARPTRAE